MRTRSARGDPILVLALALVLAGCGGDESPGQGGAVGADQDAVGANGDSVAADGGAADAHPDCGTATQCALDDEQRASDRLEGLLDDANALGQFLTEVPKGGDLHMHLSGAIYAETYMEWARAEGGFCINNNSLALSTSCKNTSTTSPVPEPSDGLFVDVIQAWSMQDFVPGSQTGEQHFFATFGKFGAISGPAYHARCLADVMKRADSENVLYVEPMLFSNSTAAKEGSKVWSGGALEEEDLPAFHADLLADSAWGASPAAIIDDIEKAEEGARQELGCAGRVAPSACRVGARYMVYISRSGSGPAVFAQMVAAFEAAKTEPRLVALNLVGPEDGTKALSPYDRHMAMLGYLHTAYKGQSPLHVTLHAGELAPKYMPPGYEISAINHIRKAVEIAHAERIGHGVDVLGESDPDGLLAELRDLGVMIEIGLSSNIQILEISGADHPLASYLAAGVPVALATDDQGVSRSSMAGEYLRAVEDQHLDYRTLKMMARTSLEKSFLAGASLWVTFDTLKSVSECAPTATSYYGDPEPAPACQKILGGSAKAAMQWELEHRFREFEATQ